MARRFIALFPACEEACRRKVMKILCLLLVLLPFYQFYLHHFDFCHWDMLLITGLMAFILGLYLAGMVQVHFFQAMVTAIPAIFLAVWWFLFPVWHSNYSLWEDAYLILLSFAMMIEILAFLVPLWKFHKIMAGAKTRLLEDADKLGLEISDLQRGREPERHDGSGKLLHGRIEDKIQCYWAIENMPTWPVDMKTGRRFKFNNVLLFIPLLGDIAKRTVEWRQVLELLKKIV